MSDPPKKIARAAYPVIKNRHKSDSGTAADMDADFDMPPRASGQKTIKHKPISSPIIDSNADFDMHPINIDSSSPAAPQNRSTELKIQPMSALDAFDDDDDPLGLSPDSTLDLGDDAVLDDLAGGNTPQVNFDSFSRRGFGRQQPS